MILLEREMTLSDPIICPLWGAKKIRRFLSRRYQAAGTVAVDRVAGQLSLAKP